MAIQVSGTTVIDDSRNLVNVIGLKTVGGTAILGSGDIAVGGSTTYNAVGTYGFFSNDSGSNQNPGDTVAGSSLEWSNGGAQGIGSPEPSGTWQFMGYGKASGADGSPATLCIRIS